MAHGLKIGSYVGRKAPDDRFAWNPGETKNGDIVDELGEAKCHV